MPLHPFRPDHKHQRGTTEMPASPTINDTAPGVVDATATKRVMEGKKQLRAALLSARQAMSTAQRARADATIAARILQWWRAGSLPVLGIYSAIRGEPDLGALYEALHADGAVLALPAVTDAAQALRFLRWAPGDTTVMDRFGVAVPARQEIVEPDALLIPCVGFNAACMRLGYGGGFYDRTLERRPRPATLGVAYDCGEASFETEAHDIALDAIVTENRIIRPA